MRLQRFLAKRCTSGRPNTCMRFEQVQSGTKCPACVVMLEYEQCVTSGLYPGGVRVALQFIRRAS